MLIGSARVDAGPDARVADLLFDGVPFSATFAGNLTRNYQNLTQLAPRR